MVCDSQKVVNTSTTSGRAIAATSRTRRLLPMPGDPTTPTTAPCPSMARSSKPSTAAISQRRPTRFDSAGPAARCPSPMPSSRRAGTGAWAPLIRTNSNSPRLAAPSTSRAVDALSITPPGGATDSIRWAIPTCSPTAA